MCGVCVPGTEGETWRDIGNMEGQRKREGKREMKGKREMVERGDEEGMSEMQKAY